MFQEIWVSTVVAVYGLMGLITIHKFRQDNPLPSKKKDHKPASAKKPPPKVCDPRLKKFIWAFGVFGAAYGMTQYKPKGMQINFKVSLLAAFVVHSLVFYQLILRRQLLADYWALATVNTVY